MTERRGVTRRGLLQGLGAAAAAGSVAGLPGVIAGAAPAFGQDGPEVLGPGPVPMRLRVNGTVREVRLEPRATLLDALRGPLGLTGPKEVCDLGACGACTVLVDGKPVCACMVLALDVAEHGGAAADVTTVEAFSGPGGAPGDLQRAFVEKDALQCGFCTCGMVTAAEGLLRARPEPSADDVRAAISGNLCRCGTYPRIVEAVLSTASLRRKGR